MDQKTLFLNTSPTRLFFKAALPGSVGMLASSLYQLLDGMFVGQLLGGEAFAALNLAMPLVIINFAISDLIGVGSSVPISVRLGEKRPEEANNIFTCACLMVLLQGLVVGSFLFFASPVLLRVGGAAAVSVYGILMYADGIVMQFLYGMCDSLQPAVGYNWGAGRRDRVLAIEKRCFSAAAIISLLGAAVLYAFPEAVASVFVSDSEPAVYAMAIPALRLFCLGYLTRWLSFATQSFMSAVEHPIQASILSVSTALVFPVLLIAVLWPFGLNGLWFNMAGTALLTCVVAIIILLDFKRRNWNSGTTR